LDIEGRYTVQFTLVGVLGPIVATFPVSSMAEHSAVNRRVGSSNLPRGVLALKMQVSELHEGLFHAYARLPFSTLTLRRKESHHNRGPPSRTCSSLDRTTVTLPDSPNILTGR